MLFRSGSGQDFYLQARQLVSQALGETREQGTTQHPGRAQGRRGPSGVGAEQVRRRWAPPRQQVPGKERGRPQGTPESLESLGELGLDPRAPCRVRPLTWKGSPPRGTALPSDQKNLAFAPREGPCPMSLWVWRHPHCPCGSGGSTQQSHSFPGSGCQEHRDRKSTRLNSSHRIASRMPSSA